MSPVRNSSPQPSGRASAGAISNGMRLLIVTQAVDRDDPVLGFFIGWIQAFAKEFESVHTICLTEGTHRLPPNVRVYSLGKESGRSRIKYLWRFFRTAWKLRREYDAVFVHMNQEYILLGGILWRILGKQIVLWRNHKKGSIWTRVAGFLAHTVCFTSPSAYVSGYSNAVQMPIGIDTDAFKPAHTQPPPDSILVLGRLDPVKRVELFIAALEILRSRGVPFTADVYGEPTEGNLDYAHEVRNQASVLSLDGDVSFRGSITNEEAPAVYTSHSVYVNLTPSGSFDKTIGEAMASGCVVVTANDAVREVVPPELFVADSSAEAVARAIHAALALDSERRARVSTRLREHILVEHSLNRLMERLMMIYTV